MLFRATMDAEGGVIEIARLEPAKPDLWRLYARDHEAGRWIWPVISAARIEELLALVVNVPIGCSGHEGPAMIYLDNNATTRPLPGGRPPTAASLPTGPTCRPSTRRTGRPQPAGRCPWRGGATARRPAGRSGVHRQRHRIQRAGLACRTGGAGRARRLVVSAIEHAGLLQAAVRGPSGRRSPQPAGGCAWVVVAAALPDLLANGAALVSVMAANNETGAIQPVAEIVRLANAVGVPVHVDATQAAGRIPVDFAALGVRFLSVSAHKLHGPKGVGAAGEGRALRFACGHQERKRAAVPKTCPASPGSAPGPARWRRCRRRPGRRAARRPRGGLRAALPGLRVFGAGVPRLWPPWPSAAWTRRWCCSAWSAPVSALPAARPAARAGTAASHVLAGDGRRRRGRARRSALLPVRRDHAGRHRHDDRNPEHALAPLLAEALTA